MGSIGGALSAPSGIGPSAQPDPGSNNLDKFISTLAGLTGQQGQGILGAGLNQTQSGINATAPVLSYLTSLVKGDQGDVTQAAQPEIDQITQQFDAIRNMISLQPRGGGKTTALAEAPFQKAGDIQRTEGALRSNASSQLGQLGLGLAGIGVSEQGIGAGLEGEGANIALSKQGLNYGQQSTLDQVIASANAFL